MYVSSSSRVIDSVCAVAEACGWILAASATLRVRALMLFELRKDTVSVVPLSFSPEKNRPINNQVYRNKQQSLGYQTMMHEY